MTNHEQAMLAKLENQRQHYQRSDRENLLYYQGKQYIQFLGLRLRQEWLSQAFPLAWCKTLVRVVVQRQQVSRLLKRGEFKEDSELRLTWDQSNMDSQISRFATDLAVYGRAFLSVSMTDGGPRIVVEPVSAMTLIHDVYGETQAALRIYDDELTQETRKILYLPDSTVIIDGKGLVTRIKHYLGRVPVVMAVSHDDDGNRHGEAIFEPLKRLADMSAEALLNARVALETTASPQKAFIDAASKVVDEDGNPVSIFETFYDNILTLFSSTDDGSQTAKIQQLPGADMKPFMDTLTMLGEQASAASGLPMRMLGHVTANPPSEMTVRGEESRLVRMVETYNNSLGAALGWALSIAERLRTGEWPEDGAIDVSWRDPGTPTMAQQTDALVKQVQVNMISRRSALEEQGWSDARIDREFDRIADEMELFSGLSYRLLGRSATGSDQVIDGEVVDQPQLREADNA
nr:phage portal protein [Corynebacterium callunae]